MTAHQSSDRRGHTPAQRMFGADLRRWREQRGLTQRMLGKRTLRSREFVAKVEQGERWPTEDFAVRADAELEAGGVLVAQWPAVEAERRRATIRPVPSLAPVLPLFPACRSAAEPATPDAQNALAALVAGVLREYPQARILLAVEPGSSDPAGGGQQMVRTAPNVPEANASGDGARVYRLPERRAR